jgi:hypothetical protein
MNKWFVAMAGPGSLEDLKELLEPIKQYFNGIVITYHGERNDPEGEYLESVKGEGKIIYLPYSQRHDFSRNAYLFCGPIKEGDWIVQSDVLERPNPKFLATYLNELISNNDGLNMFYYYGKPFVYQFSESLTYRGSPHESLIRQDGRANGAELNSVWPNEADVRLNVRPLKRKDQYGWMFHYLRYYLMPWGTNQCLLGNENRSNNIMEIFQKREVMRLKFRDMVREKGFDLSVDGVKAFLTTTELNDSLKFIVNNEKIINDAYRFWVLNDQTINDNHHWKDLKIIP